jgi:hypothetical protein
MVRLLSLGLACLVVLPAHAGTPDSAVVKNTLTYEQVGLIRMATGGELVLRKDNGVCLVTRAHPPKDKAKPVPNIDVSDYPCAPDGKKTGR